MLTDLGNVLDVDFTAGASTPQYSTYAWDSHSASIGAGATAKIAGSTVTGLRDISGQDKPLWLNIAVTGTFDTSTSVAFDLISSASTTLSTSLLVHATTGAITVANNALDAGKSYSIPFPAGLYKRYIGVRYVVVGTADASGTVTVTITSGVPLYAAYPNNWTN